MRPIALLFVLVGLTAAAGTAGAADAHAKPTATGGPAGQRDGLLGGFSLSGDRGPVKIDADTLEFDDRNKVLLYRGAVVVTQADMILHSDLLRITLEPGDMNKAREVVAEGRVQIDKGERRATGGRAVFDNAARTVTLTEQPRLREGLNEVTGERVVVYLDEQRSVVEGGQERVRAVLYPSEMKAEGGAPPGGPHER